MRSLVAVVVVAGVGCRGRAPAPPRPAVAPTEAPWSGPPRGTVTVDGVETAYVFDFDRDDLARLVVAADGAVAVTVVVPGERTHTVVLWNVLYDVSLDVATWTKRTEIPARSRWGRPDAVGAYPAITDVATAGDTLVLATARDGAWRVRGATLAAHALLDPLDGGPATVFVSGGVLHATSGALLYRLHVDGDAEAWQPTPLPSLPFAVLNLGVAAPPDGAPYVVMDSALRSPGPTTATARWEPGGLVVVGQQEDGPDADRVVALGDELWAFEWDRDIWRWSARDRRWSVAGAYPEGLELGTALRPLRTSTGWVVHDLQRDALLRVDDSGPRVTLVRVPRATAAPDLRRAADELARLRALPLLRGREIASSVALPDGGVAIALGRGGLLRLTPVNGRR